MHDAAAQAAGDGDAAATTPQQQQQQSGRSLRVRTIEILWHCNDRNEEAQMIGMQSGVMEGITSVDYNPRFDRIVTTGGDGNIRLWAVNTAAIDAWLSNTANDMLSCCRHLCRMRVAWMPLTARWSPQGEMVASAHCEGKICLWWRDSLSGGGGEQPEEEGEVEEWKAYRHLTGHISDVYDICFSADSRYLLSGAGDGSIAIHDLEASTMPVLQLTDLHTKFCRGVAWDPWTRLVHSFGCGPSLLSFTHIPKGDGSHRRMHLAGQRKCQGDYIGESCALSYRRLGWSPDGLLLAVPFGRFSKPNHQHPPSTSNLLASIDAKSRAEAGQQKKEPVSTLAPEEANAAGPSPGEHTPPSPAVDDMLHCVYIYTRGAPDKVACRLGVRGFSEVRGVKWAPCFLEPLTEDELEVKSLCLPSASPSGEDTGSATGAAAALHTHPTLSTMSRSPACAVAAPVSAEESRQRRGAWGPAEYRMALAVWTFDAVIVYTTDCSTRHSDFTDLHMLSITDVAWSSDAAHLYTASLDGYISVIAFGASLAVSHRLPSFSASPAVKGLCALLQRIEKVGLAFEDGRSSGNGARAEAGAAAASAAPTAAPSVAIVVRKKKRLEKPPVDAGGVAAPHKDVDVQQLEALLSDL